MTNHNQFAHLPDLTDRLDDWRENFKPVEIAEFKFYSPRSPTKLRYVAGRATREDGREWLVSGSEMHSLGVVLGDSFTLDSCLNYRIIKKYKKDGENKKWK